MNDNARFSCLCCRCWLPRRQEARKVEQLCVRAYYFLSLITNRDHPPLPTTHFHATLDLTSCQYAALHANDTADTA